MTSCSLDIAIVIGKLRIHGQHLGEKKDILGLLQETPAESVLTNLHGWLDLESKKFQTFK